MADDVMGNTWLTNSDAYKTYKDFNGTGV